MSSHQTLAPEDTAVRTALWRALHPQADPPPHVFEDDVGLKLIAPDPNWRNRPDMSAFTKPFRASILARARFIEDLVIEQVSAGIGQYVLLGAGLDTFAQRNPQLAARLRIFELDQPGRPQQWKRQRLLETGLGIAPNLKLVPVDFEAGDDWGQRLVESGFDPAQPAVVTSTGVSMYLTQAAIMATLRQLAALAPGSTLVMSFLLPIDMLDADTASVSSAPMAPRGSASSCRTKSCSSRGMPGLPRRGTSRRPCWPSATLPAAEMACARLRILRSCWWRRPESGAGVSRTE